MVFLSLLEKSPLYGSEIMSILNRKGSSFFIGAKEGTVYPVLYRLEDAGLVQRIPEGRQKKIFRITEKGSLQLRVMKERWAEYIREVDLLMALVPNDTDSNRGDGDQ